MSSGVRDVVRVIARITPAQLTTTSAASLCSTGGLGPDQTQPRCSSVSSVGPFAPAVEKREEVSGSLADVVRAIGRTTTAGQRCAVADGRHIGYECRDF